MQLYSQCNLLPQFAHQNGEKMTPLSIFTVDLEVLEKPTSTAKH